MKVDRCPECGFVSDGPSICRGNPDSTYQRNHPATRTEEVDIDVSDWSSNDVRNVFPEYQQLSDKETDEFLKSLQSQKSVDKAAETAAKKG